MDKRKLKKDVTIVYETDDPQQWCGTFVGYDGTKLLVRFHSGYTKRCDSKNLTEAPEGSTEGHKVVTS